MKTKLLFSIGTIAVISLIIFYFAKLTPTASVDKPNVIIISVDSLRADHLGVYGYERDTSPNIDNFAQNATVLNNTFTPIPWTIGSYASLFTGLYPTNHQVFTEKIDKKIPLLAEVMGNNGYKTAGFISSNVLSNQANNLGRGFDLYDEVDQNDLAESPSDTYKITWPNEVTFEAQRSARTTAEAKSWLQKNHDAGKFFLFLHYFNPHAYYLPPDNLANKFSADFPEQIKDKLQSVNGQKSALSFETTITPEENDYLMAKYDEEIAYTDESLAPLFKQISDLGLEKNTIIILTADHGESFDHGYLSHGKRLYDSSIKIPLIIKDPSIKEGKKVDDVISIVDVMPTLLSRLNIQTKGLFDGIDISNLLTGTGTILRKSVYTMSIPPIEKMKDKLKFMGQLYANISRNNRLIYNQDTGQSEFYDVTSDKDENTNLSDIRQEAKTQLEQLVLWLSKNKTINSENLQLNNDELRKQLNGLGYL